MKVKHDFTEASVISIQNTLAFAAMKESCQIHCFTGKL